MWKCSKFHLFGQPEPDIIFFIIFKGAVFMCKLLPPSLQNMLCMFINNGHGAKSQSKFPWSQGSALAQDTARAVVLLTGFLVLLN